MVKRSVYILFQEFFEVSNKDYQNSFKWHCVALITPGWLGRTELATWSLCFETRLKTKRRRLIVAIHSELHKVSVNNFNQRAREMCED